MLLHSSSVAIDNRAVIITGASGTGKSDLALRLIDEGAKLIADDQTELRVEGAELLASPPKTLAGIIEVMHVGLMRMDYVSSISVALVVELTPHEQNLERLPELQKIELLGKAVRRIWLPAFAASTPAKIRAVLKYSPLHGAD